MTAKSILGKLAVIGAISVIVADNVSAARVAPGRGIWSQSATSPAENGSEVQSPARRSSIRAGASGLEFVARDHTAVQLNVPATGQLWEVVWSPSSEGFSINASDGGAVGTWETFAFSLNSAGKPAAVPVNASVLAAARRFPICDAPEDPNIATVGWSKDGNVAFVVAEVPPHSSCRNMGAIRGFEVSVQTARIIRRLSEQDVRQRWPALLGCRFRTACS